MLSPGSPAERQALSMAELAETTQLDGLLTAAALAKPLSMLVTSSIADQFEHAGFCEPFTHPVLADISDELSLTLIAELPDQQADLIGSQAQLILGFQAEPAAG